jgi:DnaK suppressor protein
MSAHMIQARPKVAETVGRDPLPVPPAAAGPDGSDPARPPGIRSSLEPDPAKEPGAGARSLPHWRAVLEERWQARLREMTELSLAYHDAAAAAGADRSGDRAADGKLRDILRRTVATRRALADIEEALTRLSAGRFGRCEQCGDALPAASLALTPEARYCRACAAR